jgi:MerR family transcriptional regulator, light-induced transcriptional regulator
MIFTNSNDLSKSYVQDKMNTPTAASPPESGLLYGISAVERETGLSKDTLRVWERRYGFPRPERDAHDERAYPGIQVEKLRLIRRLMDLGQRPNKIVSLSNAELRALIENSTEQRETPAQIRGLVDLLLSRDIHGLRDALQQALMRQGLQRFVTDTVAPLNYWIGEAWMHGNVAIFDEHLYSEHVQNILRNAIVAQPGRNSAPRVLLTSLPGEKHRIGLLMVEAMLTIEGAACVALGTETPIIDIQRAVSAYDVDVIALSFSAATPATAALNGLQELRALLPPETTIWAGGSGVARCRRGVEGVSLLRSFNELQKAVAQWRAAAAG